MKTYILLLLLPGIIFCARRNHGDVAVIVVDVQKCFAESMNGSLAVKGTDEKFIKSVETATVDFRNRGYFVVATQDWHPGNHVSFFVNHKGKRKFETIQVHGRTQVLWPPHCVQNTDGANLLLNRLIYSEIIRKGSDPGYDSYSGFADDGGKKTKLGETLTGRNIKKLLIYGIATDYCVFATAMDGKKSGFDVTVIRNLSRGVNEETTRQAIEKMEKAGIKIAEYPEI